MIGNSAPFRPLGARNHNNDTSRFQVSVSVLMFLNQSGLPGLPQCHCLVAQMTLGIAAGRHEGRDPVAVWAPNGRASLKGATVSFTATSVPISSAAIVASASSLVSPCCFVFGLTALPTRFSVYIFLRGSSVGSPHLKALMHSLPGSWPTPIRSFGA